MKPTTFLGIACATLLSAACSSGSATDPSVPAPEPTPSRVLPSSLLPETSVNRSNVSIELPANQSYVGLLETGTGISVIEGVGTISTGFNDDPVGAATSRLYVYGVRDNATGALTVTDTSVLVDDTDGPEISGRRIAYETTSADLPSGAFTYQGTRLNEAENHTYARLFSVNARDAEGTRVFGQVLGGISTAPTDMPVSGMVTYVGDAVTMRTTQGGTFFGRGVSTVEADFGMGLVDVTNNYDAGNNPDQIMATGMVIDGNGFSGGTVSIMSRGVDVTEARTGGVTGTDAAGLFFGPLEGSAPVEVGGMIDIGGTTTQYQTFFIAD